MTHSAPSKLIPTRQSNPCPICSGISGKCRTGADSPVVLCMSFTQRSDTAVNYRYIKPTKDGQWGIWTPDDEAKFDRSAWKQRTELTRQIKQVELADVMSLEERDRFYCDWLAQGSLNQRDRADCSRRGLTDAEINELPAISSDFGYAIVFQGLDGQFVGAQWRAAEASDGGRYRWHKLPHGKQFPGTDEMPLAVYRTENPITLALVEGTGIKPMLAAKRFGMIAIGAAGGNHVSSLTQLKAILTTFPNLPVHVAVDAGDVVNPQVMRRHKRTAETLQDLGIEAKFLWWNQLTKDDCDVDEIDAESFKAAQLLTIADLEALIPNPAIQSETQYQQHEPSKRDRLIQKRQWQFNQYWDGGLKRDFQLSPIVAGVTTQVEYEGFCPTLDLDLADTITVQGWLGAGKTETILASTISVKEWRAIVASTPANGLNRQFAERAKRQGFDAMHYQDDVSLHRWMLECDQPGLYLACPDSFKPYAVRNIDWSTKILVIDEFSGIRKAIVHKSEQEQFFDAIAKCKQLIVADAFLSDADVALIRKLRSGSIALYRQKVQKSPVKINWIETRTQQGNISFNHDGVYFDVLQSWVDFGVRRMAIAVDSITYAKALQQVLQSFTFADGHQPCVWLACSETVEENSIFMPSPDLTIKQHQIDIVIYTPTAKSGLDIQSPFDRGLLICCGVLPPTEMLQMLGRCRHCPEWWVSAPRRPSNPGTTAPSLNGKRVQQWTEQISQAFEEFGFYAPNHLQGWGVWQALTKDIEKAFGSEYIYALLLEYFESVETIEVSSGSHQQWRKAIDQAKRQDAENTLNADLEKGWQLIQDQKQPTNNAQVWDIKLAQFWLKYPKLAQKSALAFQTADQETQRLAKQRNLAGGEHAISKRFLLQCWEIDQLKLELDLTEETIDVQRRICAEEQSEEAGVRIRKLQVKQQKLKTQLEQLEKTALDQNLNLKLDWANQQREGALDLCRTMTSRRVEKLKNWVTAIDQDPQDDRDLISYLQERRVNYSSGAFKALQNLELFRQLHLVELAKYRCGKVAAESANTTHFNTRSPIIIQLYAEFDANPMLRKLFPLIDTIEKFWQQIRSCLGALGYQSQGNKIRVRTEELHPNGTDRNGKQRFTNSKSVHFIAWLVMECSGSAFFKENFELIIEAIRDRLAAERLERQQWRESHTAPPSTAEAA